LLACCVALRRPADKLLQETLGMQNERVAMLRRTAIIVAIALLTAIAAPLRAPASLPGPLEELGRQIRTLANHFSAPSALEVLDLSTGYHTGFNASASMPAASTIKIPVMVEVFVQLQQGRFDFDHRVTLLARDKDWGSGDLCDAPVGSTFAVSELLEKMIDVSDNTATNMLIRLVGRGNINNSMTTLGLEHTRLRSDIRTEGWSIRETLRTSPADLVHLLAMMARRQLVDEWSSNEMISILEQDQYNTLLPEPLPEDIPIAHKTGSLFDTLNDAGIVYATDAPYVIAVMTTALPSQDFGRDFIHSLSRIAYSGELNFARWREDTGFVSTFTLVTPSNSSAPDVRYWSTGVPDGSGGGGKR
jgi:beta-lactamase class A